MRRILFVLCSLVALASPVVAQQDSTRTFAPSHLAAAREFMQLLRIEELSTQAATMAIDQQISMNPAASQYRETMISWVKDLFVSEEAKTAFAQIYASTFSEADLRALSAFYRTPLGQRLAAAQPILTQRGAQAGERLAEAHQAELMQRLEGPPAAKP